MLLSAGGNEYRPFRPSLITCSTVRSKRNHGMALQENHRWPRGGTERHCCGDVPAAS